MKLFKSFATALVAVGLVMSTAAVASADPAALPVTNVTLTDPTGGYSGSGKATVTWQLPSTASGITQLTLDAYDESGRSLVTTTFGSPTWTGPSEVMWLQNGMTRYVRVHARYADGTVATSAPSNSVTIPTEPGPCTSDASVSIGVGGSYIGNTPGNWSTTGSDPFVAGTSKTYQVKYVNPSVCAETFAFSQASGSVFGAPAPYVPSDWVTFSQASAIVPAWGTVTVTVTVSVPAGTSAGLYTGAAMGTTVPSAGQTGIVSAAGAGLREYIRVL